MPFAELGELRWTRHLFAFVAMWTRRVGEPSEQLHADVVMRWRLGAIKYELDRWVNHAAGLRVLVLVT
jgi:hypothetical protein